MKRMLCAALAALLLLAGLSGCGRRGAGPDEATDTDLIVVGFSQVGAESDWRAANTKSMQEALAQANGFKLIFDDAQQKQERQITAIRNFIQQEVDYIILAPTQVSGWDTILGEAKAAGIPVILVDRMIEVADESLFTCWIGSDFRKEGDMAVAWLERQFPNDELVQIVHLQGSLGSSPQLGRTEALDVGLLRHHSWELVARESGEFTQAKGQELMEEVIAQGMPFNVVYSENDNMAYGAIDALQAAGYQPGVDVAVISFDANKAALQKTLAGEISYDVECNPLHGPRVLAIIEQLEAGETPQKFTYVEETAFAASTITQAVIDGREY